MPTEKHPVDAIHPPKVDPISTKDFTRGEPICLTWDDISEDAVGDPDQPLPAIRETVTRYWGLTTIKGRDYLITTSTKDDETVFTSQNGYTIYPVGAIIKVVPLKKRRQRKLKNETPPATA